MGVSTTAIIHKGISIEKIKDCIEKTYGEVTIYKTGMDNFVTFLFKVYNRTRKLSIFGGTYAQDDHGIDGIVLSMSGNSAYIFAVLNNILKEFGGYMEHNDVFMPINIEQFNKGANLTPKELLVNDIISTVGYEHLTEILGLFEKHSLLTQDKT